MCLSIQLGNSEEALPVEANRLFPSVLAISGKTDRVSKAGKNTIMLDIK